MKKVLFIMILVIHYGCVSQPKNFTCYYINENTGLDTLIDINGYYVSQHGCDTTFYSMYMFYPNGLFTIATTSQLLPELYHCFEKGGKSLVCRYPYWGTYKVEGNTIKTQVIRTEGNGFVVFRDYKILSNKRIANISDYVEPQYSNLGYIGNYPSFHTNLCESPAIFHPLKEKRSIAECFLLKKKWFYRK